MVWATIYLLCIPGFACLYTSFPKKAWYYSTITHEQRYRDYTEAFEQVSARWLESATKPSLTVALQEAGFAKPDRLSYFVRYDPKENPTLEILLEYDKPPSFSTLWFSLENAQVSNVPFVFSNFYRLQALCQGDQKSCNATRVQGAFGSSNEFKVSKDVKARFEELRDEEGGVSAGRTLNTFFRTLYLSAVTITTVGYGDIVPLTDMARAAVASEAIIGIVLIGLFLNALAHERDLTPSR